MAHAHHQRASRHGFSVEKLLREQVAFFVVATMVKREAIALSAAFGALGRSGRTPTIR